MEQNNESDATLMDEDMNEEDSEDRSSVILPDEYLEQNLEEYESNDDLIVNLLEESNETNETKSSNSSQIKANDYNNSSIERNYKTVTIGDRVFECLPTEDGIFHCEWAACERTFTQKGNLMRHYTTHGAQKHYKCPHEGCVREFADTSSLNKHLVVHSGEKPFVCDWNSCKFRTNSRSALRDHRRYGCLICLLVLALDQSFCIILILNFIYN